MSDMSPEEIAALAREAKTSEEAFSKLYDYFMPKIFGYISSRIGNREETEDIVANTFLKAVQKIKTYNPAKSGFKTWIYTIATNTLIDHFRTNKSKKHADIEEAEVLPDQKQNPHEQAVMNHQCEKVRNVLSKLSKKHQDILHLKYFGGLEVDEIAQVLGITPGNAYVMTHRALQAFELTYNRYV